MQMDETVFWLHVNARPRQEDRVLHLARCRLCRNGEGPAMSVRGPPPGASWHGPLTRLQATSLSQSAGADDEESKEAYGKPGSVTVL
jgi:hypothetical protein